MQGAYRIMDLFFYLQSALLGAGLAMDAFSVSLANGLIEPQMPRGRLCSIAGIYGFFQFTMPAIGWFLVRTAAERFEVFSQLVPYIALGLLSYIGGKMLMEGLRHMKEEVPTFTKALTWPVLLMQGIATSIDALSVGFTLADYDMYKALTASLVIGFVTFLLCVLALHLGRRFGTRFARHASLIGGIILIAIGLEIFIQHLI